MMKIQINTANKDTKVDNATWLQGLGHALGKKAEDIKIGDVLVWNYGATSKVIGFVKETAKFITVEIECKSGVFERRLKKDRIVAIAN